MVQIREMLVKGDARKVNRGLLDYTTVTVHETGNTNTGATANAHGKLQQRGNDYPGSWHSTADDKEVVVSYEDTARCQHAGKAAGNNFSYSIEICVNSTTKEKFLAACRNAAEFAAIKLAKKGLGIGALVQHNHWTGKNCPERIRRGNWSISWAEFVELVRGFLKGETPVNPTPRPEIPIVVAPPADSSEIAWVKSYQNALANMGYYKGAIDGKPEAMTKAATRAYQEQQNKYGNAKLVVDGVWGAKTDAWYHWVENLQASLNFFANIDLRVDGDYRTATHEAVKGMQKRNGLWPDGFAEKKTLEWMRDQKSQVRNRP